MAGTHVTKPKRSQCEVRVKKQTEKYEVHFRIDQQGFILHVPEDPDETQKWKRHYAYWYAKQLRIALKRLAKNGAL